MVLSKKVINKKRLIVLRICRIISCAFVSEMTMPLVVSETNEHKLLFGAGFVITLLLLD